MARGNAPAAAGARRAGRFAGGRLGRGAMSDERSGEQDPGATPAGGGDGPTRSRLRLTRSRLRPTRSRLRPTRSRLRPALTGLAAGALLTAILLAASVVGSHYGAPSIPYSLFEWLTRVLPGRLVIYGLENTLRLLEALGFNIKDTGKAVEVALALTGLLVAGAVVGAVFFVLVTSADQRRVVRRGELLGLALGIASFVIALAVAPPATFGAHATWALWVVGSLVVWGWALARLRLLVVAPPPREETTEVPAITDSPTAYVPLERAGSAATRGRGRRPRPPPLSDPRGGCGGHLRRPRRRGRRHPHGSGRGEQPEAGHGAGPVPERRLAGQAGAGHAPGIHAGRRPLPGRHRPRAAR